MNPTGTSFPGNGCVKCLWMWEKDFFFCSFILSDTPRIPSSHSCHFLFTSAPLTGPLINRDNGVFVLVSPHRDKLLFFFFSSKSQQVRLKIRPPKCPAGSVGSTFSSLCCWNTPKKGHLHPVRTCPFRINKMCLPLETVVWRKNYKIGKLRLLLTH